MKRRITPIQVAAVASSVALVGGYVWYRVSAAPAPADAATARPTGSSSELDPRDAFLPGSKSAEVFPPETEAAELPKKKAKDRAVMGGSKSVRVLAPEDAPSGAPKDEPDGTQKSWKPPSTPPLLTPPANPK